MTSYNSSMTNDHRLGTLLVTAYAPLVWGTSYWVMTELLPPDRPLLAAAGRALPAGALLALIMRRIPPAGWRLRVAMLGVFNIGIFFSLLFVAAERLPGGVAATAGALQPLIVLLLAWPLLLLRPTRAGIACGAAGLAGVAALVLGPAAALDPIGLAAAAGGTASMALGIVLGRRFGPPPLPLLAFTAWQLLAGGLVVAPLALIVEGTPPVPTSRNLLGFAIIGIAGTAAAYALWFRGIRMLPAPSLSFLGLLSPIVATILGWATLGQSLTPLQIGGALLVAAAICAGQLVATQRAVRGPGAPALLDDEADGGLGLARGRFRLRTRGA
jgi:probable blue pigment (indigoidine) exporter